MRHCGFGFCKSLSNNFSHVRIRNIRISAVHRWALSKIDWLSSERWGNIGRGRGWERYSKKKGRKGRKMRELSFLINRISASTWTSKVTTYKAHWVSRLYTWSYIYIYIWGRRISIWQHLWSKYDDNINKDTHEKHKEDKRQYSADEQTLEEFV